MEIYLEDERGVLNHQVEFSMTEMTDSNVFHVQV